VLSTRSLFAALAGGALLLGAPPAFAAHTRRILFDDARLTRLRAMAEDAKPDSLGHVPQEMVAKLVAAADDFIANPMVVDITGADGAVVFTYTFGPQEPKLPAGETPYPFWTQLFLEGRPHVTRRIQTLTTAWLATEDAKYLAAARSMVLDFCAWDHWSDPGYPNCTKGSNGCLDSALGLGAVAYFYDQAYDALTAAERTTIAAAMKSKAILPHVVTAKNYAGAVFPNIPAIVGASAGIGAVALWDDEPAAAPGWLAAAVVVAKKHIDDQGGDGGSAEGPGYGSFAIGHITRLADAAEHVGEQTLVGLPGLLGTTDYAVAVSIPGGGGNANFGDTGRTTQVYADPMFWHAARGDGVARWQLAKFGALDSGGLSSLAYYADEVAPVEPTRQVAGFPGVGVATARTSFADDALFVAIKAGPPTLAYTHQHLDQNSLVMTLGDTWLLADYGYDSGAKGTETHNTLLVGGKGQVQKNGGSIQEALQTGAVQVITGFAAKAYAPGLLSGYRRDVWLVRPSDGAFGSTGYALVRDRVDAPAAHTFSFHWGAFELGEHQKFGDHARIVTLAEGAKHDLWLRAHGAPAVYEVAAAPFEAGKGLAHVQVSNETPTANLDQVTALVPAAKGAPDPVTTAPAANVVCLEQDGALDCAFFTAEAAAASTPLGALELDGEAALYGVGVAGAPARAFVIGASLVTGGAKLLFEGGVGSAGVAVRGDGVEADLRFDDASALRVEVHAPEALQVLRANAPQVFAKSDDGWVIFCAVPGNEAFDSCGLPPFEPPASAGSGGSGGDTGSSGSSSSNGLDSSSDGGDGGGCACRAAASEPRLASFAAVALLLLTASARRRRRPLAGGIQHRRGDERTRPRSPHRPGRSSFS
jgi:hypothetical protein